MRFYAQNDFLARREANLLVLNNYLCGNLHALFKFYIKTNQKIDLEKFKQDFEILSVLRNLKIIGIFMRLAIRDNKKKYLKLIPYAWEMINHRIKEQNEFNNLMLLLKNNFPKLIR